MGDFGLSMVFRQDQNRARTELAPAGEVICANGPGDG